MFGYVVTLMKFGEAHLEVGQGRREANWRYALWC
jgi:hypothetical protein